MATSGAQTRGRVEFSAIVKNAALRYIWRTPSCRSLAGGDRDSSRRISDMPADGDAPPRFTHKQILRVLSGILLCIFLAAIDQTVVIPAVPAIAADLHGFGHLAWIISAYL